MSKAAPFYKVQVIAPARNYDPANSATWKSRLVTVALVQSVSIDENFGTRQQNFLGSPLAIPMAGFYQATVTLEKATLDGTTIADLGGMNPLYSFFPKSYWALVSVGTQEHEGMFATATKGDGSADTESTSKELMPWMFILTAKDKLSDSYGESGIVHYEDGNTQGIKGVNNFGTWLCVANNVRTNFSATNSVVIDNLTASAKPISGRWLNRSLQKLLAAERNGMEVSVDDPTWGFEVSQYKPRV